MSSTAPDLQYMPDDFREYAELADVILLVEGQSLPVHSSILALRSRFFRKLFLDLKGSDRAQVDGKLRVPLDRPVAVRDAELMLAFVYGTRTTLDGVRNSICCGRSICPIAESYLLARLTNRCWEILRGVLMLPILHFLSVFSFSFSGALFFRCSAKDRPKEFFFRMPRSCGFVPACPVDGTFIPQLK